MNNLEFWKMPLLGYENIVTRHSKGVVESRSQCDTSIQFGKNRFSIPVAASNMPSVLDFESSETLDHLDVFYIYPRVKGAAETKKFIEHATYIGYGVISISIGLYDLELLQWIVDTKARVDYITLDVAFAYTDNIIPTVEFIKKNLPDTFLIVGNSFTGESIEFYESLGVDCAKINVGVSRSCRTRHYTSVYCPPATAIMECAAAAKNILIMADGGMTYSPEGDINIGDAYKALYLGADIVLSGAAFASATDVPAAKTGLYSGNASIANKDKIRNIEGASVQITTGQRDLYATVDWIKESIQSAMSYTGKMKLSDLSDVKYGIIY